MTKSLYAYFGALGPHNDLDIPGHSFYQLPLLEATTFALGIDDKFDFLSYVPEHIYEKANMTATFPEDAIGRILGGMYDDTISARVSYDDAIKNIVSKEYNRLVLKARFRNISTLTKKWNDALIFEDLILTALKTGYDPKNIVILDTDLSLPADFIKWAKDKEILIRIPSIDYHPMTRETAEFFLNALENAPAGEWFNTVDQIVYYGNLDTTNYKVGHSKNPIAFECLEKAFHISHFGKCYTTAVAGKVPKFMRTPECGYPVNVIERWARNQIWNEMKHSKVSLNVSKDLYTERKFIPARVYESLMLGMIPVSYNMPYIHPALSFTNVHEYSEILKFILGLDRNDFHKLRRQVVDSLLGPM